MRGCLLREAYIVWDSAVIATRAFERMVIAGTGMIDDSHTSVLQIHQSTWTLTRLHSSGVRHAKGCHEESHTDAGNRSKRDSQSLKERVETLASTFVRVSMRLSRHNVELLTPGAQTE